MRKSTPASGWSRSASGDSPNPQATIGVHGHTVQQTDFPRHVDDRMPLAKRAVLEVEIKRIGPLIDLSHPV